MTIVQYPVKNYIVSPDIAPKTVVHPHSPSLHCYPRVISALGKAKKARVIHVKVDRGF